MLPLLPGWWNTTFNQFMTLEVSKNTKSERKTATNLFKNLMKLNIYNDTQENRVKFTHLSIFLNKLICKHKFTLIQKHTLCIYEWVCVCVYVYISLSCSSLLVLWTLYWQSLYNKKPKHILIYLSKLWWRVLSYLFFFSLSHTFFFSPFT